MKFQINKDSLDKHVDRICRINLRSKKPKKICLPCSIIGPVLETMAEKGYIVADWVSSTKSIDESYQKENLVFTIDVEEEEFLNYVKRFCKGNYRQGIKICKETCPIREYVIQIGKEQDWKVFRNL